MSVNSGEFPDSSPASRQDSPGVTRLRSPGLTLHRQGQNSHASTSIYGSSGPLPATMTSPNTARFLAAFKSRSRTSPHSAQTYVRTDRSSLVFTAPHPEQVLLDGNHRSTTTVRPPLQTVLYSTCLRSSPNEAPETCRARQWFLTIPATCRSSMTTVPNSLARLVVSLWSPSLRWSAPLPCAFARAADALRQRFDGSRRFLAASSYGPTLRDTVRFRRRTFRAAPLECRGLGNS